MTVRRGWVAAVLAALVAMGSGPAHAADRPPETSLDNVASPLPYPTRDAYRIKANQPDFWADTDEIVGNNTGGVAINLVWAAWEPQPRPAPCQPAEQEYGGRCFTVPAAVDADVGAGQPRGPHAAAVVVRVRGRALHPAAPRAGPRHGAAVRVQGRAAQPA